MNTISLEELFARQSEKQAAVTDAERKLIEAKIALNALNQATQEYVVSRLDQGDTTGNTLTDEVIRFGIFSKEKIEKFLAFNERLTSSAGKELLLIFHATRPMMKQYLVGYPHGDGDGGEFTIDYPILGVLSGERLKLVKEKDDGNVGISIPFIKWVSAEAHLIELSEPKSGPGPYLLPPFLFSTPGSYPLYCKIIGEQGGPRVDVLIGDELDINEVGFRFQFIKALRDRLHNPPPGKN